MDRPVIGSIDFSLVMVNSFTQYVKYAAQSTRTNRNTDRCAGINSFHSANKTVGRTHGNCTDYIVADMLHNFTGKMDLHLTVISSTIDFNSVQDCRHTFRREFNVNNRANNLYYSTSIQGFSLPTNYSYCCFNASAPPQISLSSRVISA